MNKNILKNKNCLITGATGGLGVDLCKNFAKNKCNLFLTSTDKIKLKKLAEELKLYNKDIKVYYVTGDLNKIHDIKKIIYEVRKKFVYVDILVNCAGVFPVKLLKNTKLEDFEKCFNINIRAPFLLSKEFSQDMIKKRWGRIVNIGSSSSYGGYRETSIYCASKHALLGLSRALHDELRKYNIRIFCVSPGSLKTKMGKSVKNQEFSTFINPKEVAEYIIFIITFNKEMISEETRLNRMVIK